MSRKSWEDEMIKRKKMDEKTKMKSYEELMEELKYALPGEDCRRLHKELKRHFNGKGGLPLFMRYPNFPIIISVIAGVFAVIATVILPVVVLFAKL